MFVMIICISCIRLIAPENLPQSPLSIAPTSSADAEKPAGRDIIGGRKTIGNWLAAAPPYCMWRDVRGIGRSRGRTARPLFSVIRLKILSPPEWQAPLPVRISQP